MSVSEIGYRWFKWWIAAGILVAVLLLTTAIVNYQFVSSFIATQQTRQELSQEVVALEQRIRQLAVTDPHLLSVVIAHAKTQEMPWIEFRDGQDNVVIHRGISLAPIMSPADQRAALRQRKPAFRVRDTPMGRAVVESFGVLIPPNIEKKTPPQYAVLEMAMVITAAPGVAWPALRNLFIESAAALALLAALITMALRFRAYARGQHLEQQVEIARQVQQDLMPASGASAAGFDVSAECDPAAEVGGDFYDIFPVQDGGSAFVVGDVSGKGLPASLLMGVLHGAVRSSLWTDSAEHHEGSTRQINRLLCEHAARDRYATMFWGHYAPSASGSATGTGVLRYVNAGHPPPLLVRGGNVERLETGGPVLGLLPAATYEQGSVSFADGDLLVLYSDGIIEAANAQGEEFGIDRLAEMAAQAGNLSADTLRAQILEAVRDFSGGEIADDRTLLIIRRENQTRVQPTAEAERLAVTV
jgi:serine phosphatase RsbU (regulator of sigma subunit)